MKAKQLFERMVDDNEPCCVMYTRGEVAAYSFCQAISSLASYLTEGMQKKLLIHFHDHVKTCESCSDLLHEYEAFLSREMSEEAKKENVN